MLPLGQTTTPYQIYDAFFDVTKAASGWDIDTVKTIAERVVGDHRPDLPAPERRARRGGQVLRHHRQTRRQIKHLLGQANKVAGVLGNRSEQINRLLVNAQTLLAAINQRGRAIDALLGNVSAFSTQVQGLHQRQPQPESTCSSRCAPSATCWSSARTTWLNALTHARPSSSRRWPNPSRRDRTSRWSIVNLLPYQILQPWVDAAFKKRGIDPEKFWRSAGLPAFRWPDPNGTRFPNGAPPPAPPALEGTPDHPGPAVPPGSPCSYTPPAGRPAAAGQPAAVRGLDQAVRSAGFGLSRRRPTCRRRRPNPNGLPPTPGIPIAGRPGEPPPEFRARRCRCRHAPPGARTENLAPAGPTPPPSTFAPGLPPGPPAPPGPGRSCRPRSSRPVGTGGSGYGCHHLQYPQPALPQLSRASVIIGSLVVVLALSPAFVGWQLYQKLTTNTVVAYFPQATRCIRATRSRSWASGRFGRQDRARRRQDEGDVPLQNKYKVPANASALILNPSLVASRNIQLEPPYNGGPVLAGQRGDPDRAHPGAGGVGRAARQHQPTSSSALGPTPEQPKGPFGDIIESFADGLAGKGKQINKTLNSLSAGADRAERGPRRLLRGGAQPGAVRQRPAPKTISSSWR